MLYEGVVSSVPGHLPDASSTPSSCDHYKNVSSRCPMSPGQQSGPPLRPTVLETWTEGLLTGLVSSHRSFLAAGLPSCWLVCVCAGEGGEGGKFIENLAGVWASDSDRPSTQTPALLLIV